MAAADTVALLEASAMLAAGNTRMAQVLEHGAPEHDLRLRLLVAIDACREAQLALSDAIQPVPPGRDRISIVRD